jgi:hypothetical protein
MAKGQMRVPKEKKKPTADKSGKPKHLSAYKQAQLGTTTATPFAAAQPKKT